MSISKAASRTIQVNGTEYVWAVSVDSGFLTIVVQHASGSGQKLEATTGQWNWGDKRAITPADIRKIAEHALSAGWTPLERGPALRLQNVDSEAGL